jgi:predicted amidohydrolase YtcJ
VHAIGDRANRNALDAFEETRDAWQPLGLRHRIEHAQCLARRTFRGSPSSARRVGAVQHAPSDRDLAERFWADRLDGAYSFRDLLDAGAADRERSDAPIEELDPWGGIVARRPPRLAAGAAR